jgi:hypothetical protein
MSALLGSGTDRLVAGVERLVLRSRGHDARAMTSLRTALRPVVLARHGVAGPGAPTTAGYAGSVGRYRMAIRRQTAPLGGHG